MNFKNTIIILTSNLSQDELVATLRPEFINRIDEIITFNDLEMDTVTRIVDLRLNEVIQTLSEQNITIHVSREVRDYLAAHGYDPNYGARPIRRLIRRELLAGLARFTLTHPEHTRLTVNLKDGQMSFEPDEGPGKGRNGVISAAVPER